MSRTLSPAFFAALYAPETGEALAVLVTVTHPLLAGEVLRFSSHNTTRISDDPIRYATASRGFSFIFLPFAITIPEEADEGQPVMQLVLDNISREITPLLVSVTTPALVTIELVLASNPDVVEVSFPIFELTSAEIDAGRAVLSLSVDAMVAEPYPGDNFTPSTFGGLWATT